MRPGSSPAFAAASRYFALVPNSVTRSRSARSHRTPGAGWNGEPSYSTTVAPQASAETSQFHIIQPSVV